MMEDVWTPTDIEEPVTTSLYTVGTDTPDQPGRYRTTAGRRRTAKSLPSYHYESARPTADDGWTPMGVEQ